MIPGLGRSPAEGKGYPLQYSGLENSMDSPWGRRESDTTKQLSLHFSSLHFNWVSSTSGSRWWFSKKSGNWYIDHQNPCVFSPKTGLVKSRSTSLSKFPFSHYTKKKACLSLSQSNHSALLQDLKASEVAKRTVQNKR